MYLQGDGHKIQCMAKSVWTPVDIFMTLLDHLFQDLGHRYGDAITLTPSFIGCNCLHSSTRIFLQDLEGLYECWMWFTVDILIHPEGVQWGSVQATRIPPPQLIKPCL